MSITSSPSKMCDKCCNHPAIIYVEDLDLGKMPEWAPFPNRKLIDAHLCRTCVHEHLVEMLRHFNNAYTDRFGNIEEEVMEQGWDDCGRFELAQQSEGDEQSYVTEDGIWWDALGDENYENYELEHLVDDNSGDFNLIDPETLEWFNALLQEIRECGFVVDMFAKKGKKVYRYQTRSRSR